jgi:lysophospholipid acyltransferase (LPLAT)-like uncharacterized protein
MSAKKLLKKKPVIWVISILLSLIVRAIYFLNRVRYVFPPETLPYAYGEKPAIFCFWHGRMIMHPFINPPGRRMHVLISQHRDGVLISTIMRCFGIHTVSGSRSKDAAKALRNLLAVTARGQNIAITPDGPRGPFQKAAPGAAYIASKTGYPMFAISFSATRHKRLRSWDQFMLPKPFGRITFVAAEPIFVPADADEQTLAATTRQLEDTLTRITHEADAA